MSKGGQNPPAGNCGPQSRCEPLRDVIVKKLDQGLSAQRIWQDLVSEHGFEASHALFPSDVPSVQMERHVTARVARPPAQ